LIAWLITELIVLWRTSTLRTIPACLILHYANQFGACHAAIVVRVGLREQLNDHFRRRATSHSTLWSTATRRLG
jgi:hypothetical protein